MMIARRWARRDPVQFDKATNELPGLKSHLIINLHLRFFAPTIHSAAVCYDFPIIVFLPLFLSHFDVSPNGVEKG